jgi:hypothetical protein
MEGCCIHWLMLNYIRESLLDIERHEEKFRMC